MTNLNPSTRKCLMRIPVSPEREPRFSVEPGNAAVWRLFIEVPARNFVLRSHGFVTASLVRLLPPDWFPMNSVSIWSFRCVKTNHVLFSRPMEFNHFAYWSIAITCKGTIMEPLWPFRSRESDWPYSQCHSNLWAFSRLYQRPLWELYYTSQYWCT